MEWIWILWVQIFLFVMPWKFCRPTCWQADSSRVSGMIYGSLWALTLHFNYPKPVAHATRFQLITIKLVISAIWIALITYMSPICWLMKQFLNFLSIFILKFVPDMLPIGVTLHNEFITTVYLFQESVCLPGLLIPVIEVLRVFISRIFHGLACHELPLTRSCFLLHRSISASVSSLVVFFSSPLLLIFIWWTFALSF